MSDPACLLDHEVEKIILQFSLGTRTRISNWLPSEKKETPTESDERKQLPPGIQIVEPTHNVRIRGIPHMLDEAGFALVDALEMPRIDRKKPWRTYYTVRFVFRREEPPMSAEWRKLLAEIITPALDKLCDETCWRARAYRNPVHVNGTTMPGRAMLSLNFEAPAPPDMNDDKVRGTLGIADRTIAFIPRAA